MKKILLHPNKILLTSCVESLDESTNQTVVKELLLKMQSASHCVGLASNQIGFENSVCVVDASKAKAGAKSGNRGEFVLINPKIVNKEGHQTVREGCMSIPHFTVNVDRSVKISVKAANFEEILHFGGFEAVVVQHEIDHLRGLTILERAKSANDVYPRKVYKG